MSKCRHFAINSDLLLGNSFELGWLRISNFFFVFFFVFVCLFVCLFFFILFFFFAVTTNISWICLNRLTLIWLCNVSVMTFTWNGAYLNPCQPNGTLPRSVSCSCKKIQIHSKQIQTNCSIKNQSLCQSSTTLTRFYCSTPTVVAFTR